MDLTGIIVIDVHGMRTEEALNAIVKIQWTEQFKICVC